MLKIAIDLGTSVTKIFRIGSGIVLAEPTALTISKETGTIRAFGAEAKRLLGKTAEATDVIFPVYEGEIVDERYAAALLEYFLQKCAKRTFGGIEALFCVPCGISAEGRERYFRIAKSAGISRVNFAETPYLVALGQDVPLSESNPVFALDVGAGKTSAAAFSLDGIIAGLTMNVGGANMDTHLIDHIAELYNLKIGALTAERLKNTVGSLIPHDMKQTVINGRDVTTGRPRSVSVSSQDVLFPIRTYVDKILEYAELAMRKLPAEVSATMCRSGVYLAGGVCNLAGFADYVSQKLQMEAHLAPDVATAVILGGGRVVGSSALMKKICLE